MLKLTLSLNAYPFIDPDKSTKGLLKFLLKQVSVSSSLFNVMPRIKVISGTVKP